MRKPELISMSMRDLDRLKTVQAVVDGNLRPGLAAERLELTDRQLRRLVERYRVEGPAGLVSKLRGRPSNNQLDILVQDAVLELVRANYPDFGPTLAREKLLERHGIRLVKETLRQLMIAAGLWVPRKQRPPKIHQPRRRRSCFGELIQIDGCDHHWFEDRGPACTLLVYVDDATSKVVELLFVTSESTFSYFAATREYLTRYGKPVAFYSDKASVFRVNKAEAKGGDGITQFARALYELNIESICANSSQAKGRVERVHLTFQDRLVKELRLVGISNIEAANAFLPAFLDDYNQKFAKPPRNEHDVHRPVRADEDLDHIFVWKEKRCVSARLTLLYDKVIYLLEDTPETRALMGVYIDLYQYADGHIEPWANGHALPCKEFDKLTDIDPARVIDNKRLTHVLQIAHEVQKKRDGRRSQGPRLPGDKPRRGRPPGQKSSRDINWQDLTEAMEQRGSAELEVATDAT